MSKLDAKIDAALDRYLAAREARGEGRGTCEEFLIWLRKQELFNHKDMEEITKRYIASLCDEVWIADTRVALGLDKDDRDGDRIAVEADGKSVDLPRWIVNPGQTDDFGNSVHFLSPHAKVRHHRLHAEWMIRVGSIDAGREQLTVNAELLHRAGGNEDTEISGLLAI